MIRVSVSEAKQSLSSLLDRAAAGESIVITRHGRPVAKLDPIRTRTEPRKLGLIKGKIRVPKDFDAPLPEDILAAFEGRS